MPVAVGIRRASATTEGREHLPTSAAWRGPWSASHVIDCRETAASCRGREPLRVASGHPRNGASRMVRSVAA